MTIRKLKSISHHVLMKL